LGALVVREGRLLGYESMLYVWQNVYWIFEALAPKTKIYWGLKATKSTTCAGMKKWRDTKFNKSGGTVLKCVHK